MLDLIEVIFSLQFLLIFSLSAVLMLFLTVCVFLIFRQLSCLFRFLRFTATGPDQRLCIRSRCTLIFLRSSQGCHLVQKCDSFYVSAENIFIFLNLNSIFQT